MHKTLFIIGCIFTPFYIVLGVLFMINMVSFGFDYNGRMIFGAGLIAYGLFRVYKYYGVYQRMKGGDQ